MWYAVIDGEIWLETKAKSQKAVGSDGGQRSGTARVDEVGDFSLGHDDVGALFGSHGVSVSARLRR